MKVYVVESGYDYGTSQVEATFDSQEKAEQYISARKDGSTDPYTRGDYKSYGFDWIDWVEQEVL